jgi:hypothetical protein
MSNFLAGFLVGLLIGGSIGTLAIALVAVGSKLRSNREAVIDGSEHVVVRPALLPPLIDFEESPHARGVVLAELRERELRGES